MTGAVEKLKRIGFVTQDRARAERFFAAGFGFRVIDMCDHDERFAALLGLPGARITETVMRLGAQEIGLLTFDPPGRAYPEASTATDLWFQHIAIVVSDMSDAMAQLEKAGGFVPISQGGPQLLPPRSGSVSAFKFRDGEGHPLELLGFPADARPRAWRAAPSLGPCLGIDHSAIAVAETAHSRRFYQTCLGLQVVAQSENVGPEQERLDAVPDVEVTVTGLSPPISPTPHVELLCYATGSRRPMPRDMKANDVAATTLFLQAEALDAIASAFQAQGVRLVSDGMVTLSDGRRAIAVLDPDGHRIVVME